MFSDQLPLGTECRIVNRFFINSLPFFHIGDVTLSFGYTAHARIRKYAQHSGFERQGCNGKYAHTNAFPISEVTF